MNTIQLGDQLCKCGHPISEHSNETIDLYGGCTHKITPNFQCKCRTEKQSFDLAADNAALRALVAEMREALSLCMTSSETLSTTEEAEFNNLLARSREVAP
jgi:hypothetical protein